MTMKPRRRPARRRRQRSAMVEREPSAKPVEIGAASGEQKTIDAPFVLPDRDRWPIPFSWVAKWAPSHDDVIRGLNKKLSQTERPKLWKLEAAPEATVPIRHLIGLYRCEILELAERILDDHLRDLDFSGSADLARRAEQLGRGLARVADNAAQVLHMIAGDDSLRAKNVAKCAQIIIDAHSALRALPGALRTVAADAATSREIVRAEVDKWVLVSLRAKAALDASFGQVGVALSYTSKTTQGAILGAWIVEQCTGEDMLPSTFASQIERKC